MVTEAWEHVESTDLTVTNKDGRTSSSWVVRSAADEFEALAALEMKAPIAYALGTDYLIRQSIKIKPQGAGLYLATIEYGPEEDPKSEKKLEPLEFKYSFDTTGGKHKISLAEKEVSRQWAWSPSNSPPDLKGAINYDGKKVQGVEIIVPNLEFSITVYYSPAAMTTAFVQNLARKTGRVSSDAWLGFAAGEVLFMGASGDGTLPTIRGQRVKPVPVTFKFGASENRDDIIVGSNPQAIVKKGWQYMWVRYERLEASGLDYPVPVHAYVDDVYRELAFKPFFMFG